MMAQEQAADVSRPLDPNVQQRRASDPISSVWVGASAGTGKTKVLTDRVLRLLLPPSANSPGTPPHKILCLTYTKAGASEMAIRISGALSRWAVIPEGDEGTEKTLRFELRELLGRPPHGHEIAEARRLFAAVVDHPGGLPIMTIHSFCQSLLGRFPLEAGLIPNFKVLEEGPASELLEEARVSVLTQARRDPGSPLAAALNHLAGTLNEEQFFNLLSDIQAERRQFAALLQRHFGAQGLYSALCQHLGVMAGQSEAEIIREACVDAAFDKAALTDVALILGQGTPASDQPKALSLRNWLDQDIAGRAAMFQEYSLIYLTKEGSSRKFILTKNLAESHPAAAEAANREAVRLQDLMDRLNRARCAHLSRDLFLLAEAIAARYQALKDRKGALDFDDLILKTLALLKGSLLPGLPGMGRWVNFKLDQGLDHLLIDEAQDTNPEQWEILEALSEEFFADQSARAGYPRSVFVVGDHKQSIYSFQRASPKEFARMKAFFTGKLSAAGAELKPVNLNISFRSVPSVLALVDSVFSDDQTRKGLGLEPPRHDSYRRGAAGHVEIWPLYETPKRPKKDYWQLPLEEERAGDSGPAQLARRIAGTIEGWLARGEELPSRGRAIRPGDIMILLKSRKSGEPILKALKARGIPVGGADRMVLGEQLAVEDLMAAVNFALLPMDDLTLACLLKSPLIGVEEEDLFTLAHGRAGTLWQAIPQGPLRAYLSGLIEGSRGQGPYAFLSDLLYKPCPAHARSGLAAMQTRLGRHALDPIEELLRAAQDFESNHPASLQLFSTWQRTQKDEIKREMESAQDGGAGFVRMMTVHGSKGLQAPIVILPDTLRAVKSSANRNERRLLWPHQSELELPLWSPRKETDFKAFDEALARLEQKEDEEYRRLLYVAMTRAEDRLYIGGSCGDRGSVPESWYFHVSRGFDKLAGLETLEDGTRRITNPQIGPADRQGRDLTTPEKPRPLPDWALKGPAPEPSPPRPLTPSRPSGIEPPARSPLESIRNQVFVRGNLTHKLLQFLPDLGREARAMAGQSYLAHAGAMFTPDVQAEILAETLAVLDHPDFAPLFGPGSQAEVAVSGFTRSGELLSGQIDRLLVTEQKIFILDYKTNRAPPSNSRDIPPSYIHQLQGYASLLQEIYPGRAVACALIWTDGPLLMPVELKPVDSTAPPPSSP